MKAHRILHAASECAKLALIFGVCFYVGAYLGSPL